LAAHNLDVVGKLATIDDETQRPDGADLDGGTRLEQAPSRTAVDDPRLKIARQKAEPV
jgi:hypothetical protein